MNSKNIHYAYKRTKKKPYDRRTETAKKIEAIKDYIRSYRKKYCMSPAIRDIANEFKMSTSTVAYYINILDREGWLRPRQPGLSRNIIPMEEKS
jgi:SOS-response transcriptional repressor LexA